MSPLLIVSILLFLADIVCLIISAKGKGLVKTISIFAAPVLSFIIPFLLSPYFVSIFQNGDLNLAKAIGYTGGFLVFVATLGFLLRDWHPAIGTTLLFIFLVLGVATIIMGIFLSKSFFINQPTNLAIISLLQE